MRVNRVAGLESRVAATVSSGLSRSCNEPRPVGSSLAPGRIQDFGMETEDEHDDAIRLATQRTRQAQADVTRVVEAHEVPPTPATERVVERADDLDELLHDDSS